MLTYYKLITTLGVIKEHITKGEKKESEEEYVALKESFLNLIKGFKEIIERNKYPEVEKDINRLLNTILFEFMVDEDDIFAYMEFKVIFNYLGLDEVEEISFFEDMVDRISDLVVLTENF